MTDGPELLRIGVGGVVPIRWDAMKAGQDPGTLTGWASIYNVVDRQDEVVAQGAFKRSLDRWRASKGQHVIPLTLDHQNTAEGVIGSLTDAVDNAAGLRATFTFSSTQKAQDARMKAREGHLNGLSIFGGIIKKSADWYEGREVLVLREVALMSIGLTPMPANTGALVLTAKAVSNTPWSQFSQADYTDEQWARACLIDTGQGEGKQRYKLPVKEPSGTVNRNGAHAAAGALAGARTPMQASAEQKAAAARKLVSIYRNDLGEDPPDSLLRMAGMMSASLDFDEFTTAMRSALDVTHPAAMKAAVQVLLGSYQAESPVEAPSEEPAGTATENSDEETSDAAAYALDIAGLSGPGDSPPGGDSSSNSLADPLVSFDAEKIKSEIEALEAEIQKEGE